MSKKKKRSKEEANLEIMRRRTVLGDGTVVLEGRYILMPNGTLRDAKNEIDMKRWRDRQNKPKEQSNESEADE